jgi:hypothetical protein
MKKILLGAVAAPLICIGSVNPAIADGPGGLIGWLVGGHDLPPVDNQGYRDECGGCHIAFPPGLLPAHAWRRVMETLKNHYGDDVAITPSASKEVLGYLTANAARDSDDFRPHGPETRPGSSHAPRITDTVYFYGRHHEISQRYVNNHSKIGSFANCQACHKNADKTIFSEEEVIIPPMAQSDSSGSRAR